MAKKKRAAKSRTAANSSSTVSQPVRRSARWNKGMSESARAAATAPQSKRRRVEESSGGEQPLAGSASPLTERDLLPEAMLAIADDPRSVIQRLETIEESLAAPLARFEDAVLPEAQRLETLRAPKEEVNPVTSIPDDAVSDSGRRDPEDIPSDVIERFRVHIGVFEEAAIEYKAWLREVIRYVFECIGSNRLFRLQETTPRWLAPSLVWKYESYTKNSDVKPTDLLIELRESMSVMTKFYTFHSMKLVKMGDILEGTGSSAELQNTANSAILEAFEGSKWIIGEEDFSEIVSMSIAMKTHLQQCVDGMNRSLEVMTKLSEADETKKSGDADKGTNPVAQEEN